MKEDFSKYNGEGTELRRVQKRSLEILIEIDKICREHSIQCWLQFGSMLGAVRHDGFIPWDDDIDLSIMQKDVKKFRKAMLSDLPDWLALQDWVTDKKYFLDSVVKVRDRKSFFPIEVYKSFKEQGILVDIVPMEIIPSLSFKTWVRKVNKFPYLRKKDLSIFGKSEHNVKGFFLSPISSLTKSFAHFYSAISSSKRIGLNYTFVLKNYDNKYYSIEDIFPLKEHIFEGHMFYIPNNAHKVLSVLYGEDYNEIPPVEKRITHTSNVIFYE